MESPSHGGLDDFPDVNYRWFLGEPAVNLQALGPFSKRSPAGRDRRGGLASNCWSFDRWYQSMVTWYPRGGGQVAENLWNFWDSCFFLNWDVCTWKKVLSSLCLDWRALKVRGESSVNFWKKACYIHSFWDVFLWWTWLNVSFLSYPSSDLRTLSLWVTRGGEHLHFFW